MSCGSCGGYRMWGRGAIGRLLGMERVSDGEWGDNVAIMDNRGDRDGESNMSHSWW